MRHPLFAAAVLILTVLAAGPALAEITVSITAVSPTSGVIGEGETATISWEIDGGGATGTYDVVVGGDGTPGTGDAVADANGSGSFTGTKTGQTIITPEDLGAGGQYVIYVIAVNDADAADYGSASTTITLDIPPAVVSGVSAGIGDGRLFLAWNANEETNLSYYLVYYATHSGTAKADYDGAESSLGTSPINADDVTEIILSGLTNGQEYFIRISAVNDSGKEGDLSEEVSGIPTKSMGAAGLAKDTDGCFIATAAFGSYDDLYVMKLRAFRDVVLMKSEAGRAFVRAYYRFSPPIARLVVRSPTLRSMVRAALRPLAFAASMNAGRAVSLAAVFFTLVPMTAFLLIRRIARRKGF